MTVPRPQSIRIHSLDHGRAALTAARQAGRAVVLESPKGAALGQGIGWWRALLAALKREFPDFAFGSVLDCADAPGAALAALMDGIPAVRVEAAGAVQEKLAAVAEQVSGRVDTANEEGDILDLLGIADPGGTCRDRLEAVVQGGRTRQHGEIRNN